MPLTKKGSMIMKSMQKEYGKDNGKQVFYKSKNKDTIEGVDKSREKSHQEMCKKGIIC